MTGYWRRLQDVVADRGPLCVGIDPHPALLNAWGLSNDARGLESFSAQIIAALGDQVAAFKPQSAFFESHGSAGIAVLERTLAAIAETGALSILDAKRGDIGSTMEAYADAYLGEGSALAADAVTLSPYLGFGSLTPAFQRAQDTGRGVYVLARTSNPEGARLQLALSEDNSVAQSIIDAADQANHAARQRLIGVVVGGTHESLGCDLSDFSGSILVPGIGFQGGRMSDLPGLFADAVDQVLPVVGRGVLGAGPTPERMREKVASLLAESW